MPVGQRSRWPTGYLVTPMVKLLLPPAVLLGCIREGRVLHRGVVVRTLNVLGDHGVRKQIGVLQWKTSHKHHSGELPGKHRSTNGTNPSCACASRCARSRRPMRVRSEERRVGKECRWRG